MRNLLRRKKGQALTEFAVAVPTMVIILLFSQFFYEALQVKLKTQEMVRYAGYEFTGHALHDMDSGKMLFSTAKSDVNSDTNARFQNLNSTDKRSDASQYLAGKWTVKSIDSKDKAEPLIPGGTMANMILKGLGWALDIWRMAIIAKHPNVVYAAAAAWYTYKRNTDFGGAAMNTFNPSKEWKLNKKGYIETRARISYENLWIPRKFFGANISLRRINFEEQHAVLADSWKLNYGDDVVGHDDSNTAYYKQVSRMTFISTRAKKIFKTYFQVIRVMTNLLANIAIQPSLQMKDLTETALYAKNYKGDLESGTITIREDTGDDVMYHTLPFKNNTEYVDSFNNRGENYLGCPEKESMGCTSSLSTDNPFGDYIIPEEVAH